MTENERAQRLNEIVDSMLGRPRRNALAALLDPFDVEPPTQHANKSTFLVEKTAVAEALRHLDACFDLLRVRDEDSEERKTALNVTTMSIDRLGRTTASKESVESPNDLILNNALAHQFYYNTMLSLIYFRRALADRLSNLRNQEMQYWSTAHRPPNYYPRTIALRLARLYGLEKGERPTVGVARDGGHPSTSYTKALEQVFQVLGINANVRRAAKWAVDQLTDEDLKRPELGSLLGYGFASKVQQPTLSDIYDES